MKDVVYQKAEKEIKELIDRYGLNFTYDFDSSVINKLMFPINKEGYTIKDIVSKLKPDEKIIFFLNDGQTWNGKQGNESKFMYNSKYDKSTYTETT